MRQRGLSESEPKSRDENWARPGNAGPGRLNVQQGAIEAVQEQAAFSLAQHRYAAIVPANQATSTTARCRQFPSPRILQRMFCHSSSPGLQEWRGGVGRGSSVRSGCEVASSCASASALGDDCSVWLGGRLAAFRWC